MPQQALFYGGPAILLPAFPLARMLAAPSAGTLNNGRCVTVQDHRSTLTTQQHHLRLVFDKLLEVSIVQSSAPARTLRSIVIAVPLFTPFKVCQAPRQTCEPHGSL